MDEACFGLRYNLFPTIGANGPCQVHVNLGQMGFVFVEANVKKWAVGNAQGTLAPPPAYGNEAGSLLLERGRTGETSQLLGGQNTTCMPSLSNYGSTNTHHIPSIIEPIPSSSSSTSDEDDNTPLIQHVRSNTSIPIPASSREVPAHSPPSYSTFPGLSFLLSRSNSSREELERNRRAGLV